ncbi:MAG TPA: LCP family protein, partial [Candidatus Faecisoma merdavium]|nr:LCP family protein [Candidatus Faecisoma merdavium]
MKFSINKTLYVIFTFLILLFLIFIFGTNIVPLKYLILLLVFFVLYDIGLFFLLFKKNKKKNIIGYVLGGLIIVLMGVLFYYLSITMGFFKGFGNNKYKEENYLILVLEESEFDSISDLTNIGYTTNELSNIDKALEKLNNETDIENIKYDNSSLMFEDLINKNVDSVMIEESSMSLIYEQNEEYSGMFKTIHTINIKTEIEIKSEVDVTNSPFSIYISGIDSYGSIATVSRSDVNMIATINPNTKQVLLVSVPRDYYVQLRGTTGYKDKLTHAGVYGVETSMGTLEDLLDTEINYYARVNFTSLEKIVDALGGVDVYSKYSFTSSQATGATYYFSKGYNHMNGQQALSFSRERKALPGGDRSRGENQQAVIDGIIRKATSPAIITGYVKILNSLKDTFQTNMTDTDIQKLIKM